MSKLARIKDILGLIVDIVEGLFYMIVGRPIAKIGTKRFFKLAVIANIILTVLGYYGFVPIWWASALIVVAWIIFLIVE